MSKQWCGNGRNTLFDEAGTVRRFARLLVRVFFRRVEVEGAEHLDTSRPTVLVADHRNGLVDALVLLAVLPRPPRFLGKSTLFAIPPLWPLLKLARVVPVYRSEDRGAGGRNLAAFERSHGILRDGGLLAVFPEGISHNQPALQRLHTGAARIALDAAANGDRAPVETVAVALVYDDKSRFRSRALVRVGVPEPVAPWRSSYLADGPDTVRRLTDDLGDRIGRLAPDVGSWQQAERFARIAEIVARPTDDVLPHDVRLATRQRIADVLGAAPGRAVRRSVALRTLDDAFDTYQARLSLLGLTDAQVAASHPSDRVPWLVASSLAVMILTLPLAAFGVVVHVIPYEIVKQVARLPRNEGIRSTAKLLGCLLLFPVTYAAVGVVVGSRFGPLAGAAAALAAPVGGYLAVRLSERVRRTDLAIEGARLARRRGRLSHSLRIDRAAVVTAARAVLDGPRPDDDAAGEPSLRVALP